ncbi:MAG: Enoyl-CoA hydratase [Labilithrix sp.]|nr:Enoyl-CoA hydratase [Labilithrix sp.]
MSEVVVTKNGSVLEVVLDRPKKRNSITFAMYDALTAAFTSAQADPSVRVVLLSGTGEAFCAGNDINDFIAAGPSFDPETAPPLRFIESMIALEKPFVAAVQGAAVGIGTTLLLHADLVYAAAGARFSVPFANLGLVPEAASSLLLPRRVGQALANDMLLRGLVLEAGRALAVGLVNEIAPGTAEVLALARERAAEIASKPPQAIRLTKALARVDPGVLRARVLEEGRLFAARLTSDEAREAFTAFFERRPADFSRF